MKHFPFVFVFSSLLTHRLIHHFKSASCFFSYQTTKVARATALTLSSSLCTFIFLCLSFVVLFHLRSSLRLTHPYHSFIISSSAIGACSLSSVSLRSQSTSKREFDIREREKGGGTVLSNMQSGAWGWGGKNR